MAFVPKLFITNSILRAFIGKVSESNYSNTTLDAAIEWASGDVIFYTKKTNWDTDQTHRYYQAIKGATAWFAASYLRSVERSSTGEADLEKKQEQERKFTVEKLKEIGAELLATGEVTLPESPDYNAVILPASYPMNPDGEDFLATKYKAFRTYYHESLLDQYQTEHTL
jgi:hypothetical protein